ncbi:hypothetical protein EBZ80_23665 [bacterium]|nr:hypothetical protein [bacterium]
MAPRETSRSFELHGQSVADPEKVVPHPPVCSIRHADAVDALQVLQHVQRRRVEHRGRQEVVDGRWTLAARDALGVEVDGHAVLLPVKGRAPQDEQSWQLVAIVRRVHEFERGGERFNHVGRLGTVRRGAADDHGPCHGRCCRGAGTLAQKCPEGKLQDERQVVTDKRNAMVQIDIQIGKVNDVHVLDGHVTNVEGRDG